MVLMTPSSTLHFASCHLPFFLAEAEFTISQHPTATDSVCFLCNCVLPERLSSCRKRQEFFQGGSVGLRAQTSSSSLTTRFDTAFNPYFIQDRAKATQRQQCKGTGYKRNLGETIYQHLFLNSGIQTVFVGIICNSNKTASL